MTIFYVKSLTYPSSHFISFLAAVPRGGPHIQGYKVDVSLGDELQINCTSLYSKPAANLQFFINNKVSSQFACRPRRDLHLKRFSE